MSPSRTAFVGFAALGTLLGGCVLPPRSAPVSIPALPGLEPVAMYRFADNRGTEADVIGQSFFQVREGSPGDPGHA